MPTSHNLILFTLATSGMASVSVLGLILAGLVPALILTLCNLGAAWWVARRRGYPTHGAFPGWGAVAVAFAASLPGLAVVGSSWAASCRVRSRPPNRRPSRWPGRC
jgi:TRAP-type C4-dicarboxylate transport system permease large subunit